MKRFWRWLHERTGHKWRTVEWQPLWLDNGQTGRFREHWCDRCDFIRYEFDPPPSARGPLARYYPVSA